MRIMCKSKIKWLKVTKLEPEYEGSITINKEILKKANIWEGEKVLVANLRNGERFDTYAIVGKDDEVILNGPAARKGKVGDKIAILAWEITNKKIKPRTVKIKN